MAFQQHGEPKTAGDEREWAEVRRRPTRRALLRRSAVLALGVAAPLVVACGGGGGAAQEAPAAKFKGGSSLLYWNDQGGPYPGLMQQWADKFQQKTNVKVEASGGIGDYGNKLPASFAAGAAPDVFRYLQENIPLPAAVERNMLLKLDSYVKRDKYDLNDFRKDSIDLYRWKGALYALPRDYGLQLIYYNTDVFAREGLPPIPTDWNDKTWTFQRFVDTCIRVTRPGERFALFENRGRRPWLSWVYSNGGALVKKNQDGIATEFATTDKPVVDALQLMQDLIYKHKVSPHPDEEAGLGKEIELLTSGRLVMKIGNPSDNNLFLPTGMPYDVGVFPLGPTGTRRGVGGGGTGWAINAGTKLPEESWAFLAYITSVEGELDEVRIGQTTPSRVSVVTGKDYLDPTKPPKGARAYADGQDYVVRDPVHTKWPDAARDVVDKLMNEGLWSGTASAGQVAKDIKEKGDPYFKS